jgi:hypothetical protein
MALTSVSPVPGIAIIGAADEPESFRQHYFDSRGVHRISR